jgi:hypothetical protein
MAAYDQRYQVFVSSTYFDLKEERQAVIMALLQLNAIPAGMELFPADDENAWTLIKEVIDDCDYYLLVVGGKYGSVDPIEAISYTEKEYDYAVAQRKPVMAFLHGNPDAIPVGKAERSEEAQEKLAAFRAKVERGKHVKYWSGEDLSGKVALSFPQFTRRHPAAGWVRGDRQASPEMLAELNDLRKRLSETESALDQARTSPPAGTEDLAQGTDSFETWLHYSAAYQVASGNVHRINNAIEIGPSWDEIFGGLGPLMLDESAQEDLGDHIDKWLRQKYVDQVLDDTNVIVKSRGHKPDKDGLYNYKASVTNEDFHTILVQLMALGLITKSERRRSVADRGTYWTLTPYGQTRLIQLRAIRRDGTPGVASESVPMLAGSPMTGAADGQQPDQGDTEASPEQS